MFESGDFTGLRTGACSDGSPPRSGDWSWAGRAASHQRESSVPQKRAHEYGESMLMRRILACSLSSRPFLNYNGCVFPSSRTKRTQDVCVVQWMLFVLRTMGASSRHKLSVRRVGGQMNECHVQFQLV